MQRSKDRILTTHAGSLPRPADLLAMIYSRMNGEPLDEAAFQERLRGAVKDIVRKQVDLGLDVVDDGEFGKPSFMTYVNERLGGFAPDPDAPQGSPWATSREAQSFPDFYRKETAHAAAKHRRMVCRGPIRYRGHAALKTDLDNLKAAVAGHDVADVFVPAVSPSNVEEWNRNQHYDSDEAYLFAIAEAMREEYRAIIEAGFLLQIDDPRLVTYYTLEPGLSLADCRTWAALHVEALNFALEGIPREKVRHHTCYGINMGPRIHDMELKDIIDILLRVNAGAFSFEAANPRHEHEWQVWKDVKLPADTILIPGVITQSTVLVEHPELVAQRILRFAEVAGRDRVIAGADCGFATFAGSNEVPEPVVWAKFEALVKGAAIASEHLWGRRKIAS